MANRMVMWPRRHSVERVKHPGDLIALGAVNPVATPFPGLPRIDNEFGMGPNTDLPEGPPPLPTQPEGIPARVSFPSMAADLELAALARTEPNRGRGRPPLHQKAKKK